MRPLAASRPSPDGWRPDPEALKALVPSLNGVTVLVVGDVMLDEYIWGRVRRISPEAPIPVVEVEETTIVPGGAANVAHNIVALGGRALLCGVIGVDDAGRRLREALAQAGILHELVAIEGRPTTIKTRIVAYSQHESQQIVRVDREERSAVDRPTTRRLLEAIRVLLPDVQAVIVSDYAKGVVTAPLMEAIKKAARATDRMVLVDPKGTDYRKYREATVVTPNAGEAAAAAGREPKREEDWRDLMELLLQRLQCQALVVTRGARGLNVLEANGRFAHIPAVPREVYDATGAGDTFIATMALALGAGTSYLEAAALGNYAASVAVGKLGTATVAAEELVHALA